MSTLPQLKTMQYRDLVDTRPLRLIRNDRLLGEAQKVINKLAILPRLTRGQADYLEVLTVLVEKYEDEHYVINIDQLGPIELLKHLLDENGMTGSDLGRLLGHRELGAKILSKKQSLSKRHIKILAEQFKVDAGLFL